MNYNNILKEIHDRRFAVTRIAKIVGITPQGLYGAINNGTLRIDYLEIISKTIGVPMNYWFQDEDLVMHDKDPGYVLQSNAEIKKLNTLIEELRDDKKRMKDQIDELKSDKIAMRSDFDLILSKHGISKVGT